MATDTWTTNTTANWTATANWSAAAVPQTSDTALFNVSSGAAYTVTISTAQTIGVLDFASSVGTLVWVALGSGKLTTNSVDLTAGTIKFASTGSDLIVNNGFTIAGGSFLENASSGTSGKFPTFGSLTVSSGTFQLSGASTTSLGVTGNADFAGGIESIGGGTLNAGGILNAGTVTIEGAGNSLALQGGTVTSTTANAVNTIAAGATFTLSASGSLSALANFTNGGLAINSTGLLKGAGVVEGVLSDGGTSGGEVRASGGTLELTSAIAASSGLAYNIGTTTPGPVMQLDGTVGSGNTFTFITASTGAVELNNGTANTFAGTVAGLTTATTAGTVTGSDYLNIQATVTQVTAGGSSGDVFDGSITSIEIFGTLGGTTGLIETINLSSAPTAGTFLNWGTASAIGGSGITSGYDVFLDSAVCFARGTLIRTPHGDVAVEDLAADDLVITLSDDVQVARPVRWVGYRRVNLARHPQVNVAAPIRIASDAFGPGLPKRALVVSPDHCLFVDGKLIPAKLLINDTTITQMRQLAAVEYYHVELDQHAVLLAEGLPAESYLDTGNRAFFSNGGLALVLHPEFQVNAGLRCWETDACAPLAVSPAAVEPVWRRLLERALSLGYQLETQATTTDPELRLIADGHVLRPLSRTDKRSVFMLPSGVKSLRLASRASVPSYREAYLDDWRTLGVAVSRIVARCGAEQFDMPVDHPALTSGWHAVEREGQGLRRWTNGDAHLPLERITDGGPTVLEVYTTCSQIYPLDQAEARRRLAA